MFAVIQKEYPKNFAFIIQRDFKIFTRKVANVCLLTYNDSRVR